MAMLIMRKYGRIDDEGVLSRSKCSKRRIERAAGSDAGRYRD